MNLILKHKESSKIHSMIYNHWIHEIVKKGKANNYLVLDYPDIVQLINIDPNGNKTNCKITERKTAQLEIDKYPKAFELVEIDVKQQILSDIKLSAEIANQNQSSSKSSKNSGEVQIMQRIVAIIGAIKKLSPIFKIIIAIMIAGLGALLGYILIEWYRSLSFV